MFYSVIDSRLSLTSKFIGDKPIWRRLQILFDFKTRDVVISEIFLYTVNFFISPRHYGAMSKCVWCLLHELRMSASIVFWIFTVEANFINDSTNNVIRFLKLNSRNFWWPSALIYQRNIYPKSLNDSCDQQVFIEDCRNPNYLRLTDFSDFWYATFIIKYGDKSKLLRS